MQMIAILSKIHKANFKSHFECWAESTTQSINQSIKCVIRNRKATLHDQDKTETNICILDETTAFYGLLDRLYDVKIKDFHFQKLLARLRRKSSKIEEFH
jgi:hypothetical protein